MQKFGAAAKAEIFKAQNIKKGHLSLDFGVQNTFRLNIVHKKA